MKVGGSQFKGRGGLNLVAIYAEAKNDAGLLQDGCSFEDEAYTAFLSNH